MQVLLIIGTAPPRQFLRRREEKFQRDDGGDEVQMLFTIRREFIINCLVDKVSAAAASIHQAIQEQLA